MQRQCSNRLMCGVGASASGEGRGKLSFFFPSCGHVRRSVQANATPILNPSIPSIKKFSFGALKCFIKPEVPWSKHVYRYCPELEQRSSLKLTMTRLAANEVRKGHVYDQYARTPAAVFLPSLAVSHASDVTAQHHPNQSGNGDGECCYNVSSAAALTPLLQPSAK